MIINVFKNYEEKTLEKLKIDYKGLNWCELGNQGYNGKVAKDMYKSKGVLHTSIDINGLDGALKLDLDKPIPKNLENKFDVITNYGTTEHVNDQYSVFRNMHNMGKVGCVMFHGVPMIGNWPKHCRYYYSTEFFAALAKACAYTVVDLKVFNKEFYVAPKNLVACILRKEEKSMFVSKAAFASLPGIKDTKNLLKTGNYSPRKK